ncbi:MAG: hypothetical protein Q8L09_03245 [Candidatus Moranbacteria bacterium]|nr:hypothetical protein [Candidatus Moranbacteria bacterium]
MNTFKLKDNSLAVCKAIVSSNPQISYFEIISHQVGLNWRQIYKKDKEKLEHLNSAFTHEQPHTRVRYNREDFKNLSLENLQKTKANLVWSFTSRVFCKDGKYRHIPMMNFHSETASINNIVTAIQCVCGDKPGAILNSGRYFHYYGNFLLDQNAWIKFMASFLMPCILVSPRYIGHRLSDGYCSLRLTAEKRYKPITPTVVYIF